MFGLFKKKSSGENQRADLERYGGSIKLGLEVYERYERACLARKKDIIIQLHVQMLYSEYGDSVCKFFVFTWDVYPGTVSRDDQEAFEALYEKVPPRDGDVYGEAHYECARQLIGLSVKNGEKVLDAVIARFNNSHPLCQISKTESGYYRREVNGVYK